MKKLLLLVIAGAFMFTSCLATYDFKVDVKIGGGKTIMCKTNGKNKVADLYCDFTMKAGPVVWNCHTLMKDLKKDWVPSIDAGCAVVVDLNEETKGE